MATDDRLSELLLRWEETRANYGKNLSAEELCAECPELLEEVRRQLRALQSLDPLLTGAGTADEWAALAPGYMPPAVPGYEILGELGRGGMGVVYQAWQTKLNRPAPAPEHRANSRHRRA